MTLYVVHGNTCYDGYGHVENIFGVYTEKDAAEAAKDLVTKQLYDENKDDKLTIIEDLSDIEVGIVEIETDKLVENELGGYSSLPYSELITGLYIGLDLSIAEKRFTQPFPWIKEDVVYCDNCEHFHDCLNKGGLTDVTISDDITEGRYIKKPRYDCPKEKE